MDKELNIDALEEAIEDELAPRVLAAAEHLRDKIAAAWPRRSGETAKKISVVRGAHRLHKRVYIPFPGGFIERGFIAGGTGTKKYVPARPIAQQTLLAEKENLDRIILGK